MVLLTDVALHIAVFCREVIQLPVVALLCQRRTLIQVLIPLGAVLAGRDHALARLGVEVRGLGQTRATIVSSEVSMVHLTFVIALLGAEVVGLPLLAVLAHWRALYQLYVVLVASGANDRPTGPGLRVEQRLLRGAGAGVIFLHVGMVHLALVYAHLVREVIQLPGRTVTGNRAALHQVGIVSGPLRALWHEALPGSVVELGLLRRAQASVGPPVVGHIYLTHIVAVLSSEVVGLPGRAVLLGFRALDQDLVPEVACRADWLNALPGLGVKLRLFGGARAGVGLLEVSVVDGAHVQALALIEAPLLPDFAFVVEQSAVPQLLVPLGIVRAGRNRAILGGGVEEWPFRRTRTGIVFFEVGLVLLALMDALPTREVVAVPGPAVARNRRAGHQGWVVLLA